MARRRSKKGIPPPDPELAKRWRRGFLKRTVERKGCRWAVDQFAGAIERLKKEGGQSGKRWIKEIQDEIKWLKKQNWCRLEGKRR